MLSGSKESLFMDSKEYQKQYRAEHKEQLAGQTTRWYRKVKDNPVVRAGYNRRQKEWRAKHLEESRKISRDAMAEKRKDPEMRKLLSERSMKCRAKKIAENKAYVDEYKRAHPCSCGEARPWCLDFHHRDPKTKKLRIANACGGQYKTLEAVKEEIAKCDVLCANCHRDRHHQEQQAQQEKTGCLSMKY